MWHSALFALLSTTATAATTLATLGDSFADAIYLAIKGQPGLLNKGGIQLVRWSRPAVGLTRTDYFDYAGWLRETEDLGVASYCVVQVGANDMQSLPAAPGKWVLFPSENWKRAYGVRVQAVVENLRTQRCRAIDLGASTRLRKERVSGAQSSTDQ